MKIRHERPMSDLSFQVRAPLGLELSTGEAVTVENWSLQGFEFPGTSDILPKEATLSIPFQGVDIRFPVKLDSEPGTRFLTFEALTGRQRETLAVFYRSILSGRMAATDDIITSLDTPVDLVPMEETEAEKTVAVSRTLPRAFRIVWNLCVYAVLATLVFGLMGGQVASLLDKIDVDRGRVVAPVLPHVAPTDAFVREIRVAPGDNVRAGDVLMVLGDANLDDAIANARQRGNTVARKLRNAETAFAELRVAMGDESEPALPITARHALAARLQAEFFADGDTENMHKLWLSLRDINGELAPAFAPDTVIAERLHALIGELETELADLREIEALREKRQDEARVVALFDGTVLDIAAHEDQFVTENATVLQLEHNEPRTMLGWVSSEVADRVHLGQRVGISFANGDQVLSAEGRVADVVAGPDPGQPNAFGMLVTIAPTGMDTDTLRETFPADAPVSLTIHRDRLTRIDDWVVEQAHAAWGMFQ